MTRWPNVTVLELWFIIWLTDRLSRPAKVPPVVVPGR